jgi:hypothetical protein
MANYVSRVASPRVPDYNVIKVRVPAGVTLTPGSFIPLVKLDDTLPNNWQVFAGEKPVTANLASQMAIVINDGFETLPDGRRPDGQPDYTKFTFIEGDVVTAILLTPGLVFELSVDCITNGTAAVAGDVIEPVNGAYLGSRIAAATGRSAAVMSGLKVLAAGKSFRLGGQFGGTFVKTVVAMATPPKVGA